MNYTIRPILPGDAQDMYRMRIQPGVTETTSAMPSERLAHSERFVNGMGENDHHFVAVTQSPEGGEHVIGSVGITVYGGRKRHCAGLGIMVRRECQGLGIGKALLETILDIADNWLGLTRVELTVFADNARAIHLYEKYGFVREGLHRAAILRAGEYCDEWSMARVVGHRPQAAAE